MSHVLTAILVLDGDSACQWGGTANTVLIGRINSWLKENSEPVGLMPFDDWGGKSAAQVTCYCLASNHLDLEEFLEFLRGLPWHPSGPLRMGDIVQLVANAEHDRGVHVHEIFGKAEVGTR